MANNLNTSDFFVGGGGMFIQYHDVIKPVYLYAVVKMIITGETHGLPTSILDDFSIASIVEWYKNRRFKNPLKQLDWDDKYSIEEMDNLLNDILKNDPSIYTLAPLLNIERIFSVYTQQHMSFPVFVYSEEYDSAIEEDCKSSLNNIHYEYLYGDLRECIKKCDQNFTYIFSDIELVNSATEILMGTYSHILLTRDYRYNYKDFFNTFIYDLNDMMYKHPFVRIGTTTAMDIELLENSFDNIIEKPEEEVDEDDIGLFVDTSDSE